MVMRLNPVPQLTLRLNSWCLELRDQATAIPKLDVVTVDEAPGVFFRDLVTRTCQINRPDDATVHVNNIGSIICQLRLDFPGAAHQTVRAKGPAERARAYRNN
jgi:hypothetical protein